MPWISARVFEWLPLPRAAWRALAVAQLRGAAAQTGVSLAAIVAAVGLMVSMAIMVASFRTSLDSLAAPHAAGRYLSACRSGGDTGFLDQAAQQAIARLPGLQRVEFLRAQQILLDPAFPRVTLLARDLDADACRNRAAAGRPAWCMPAPGDPPPVWITEPVADLFGLRPGARVALPLAGAACPSPWPASGATMRGRTVHFLIDRALYIQLTGDRLATDAGLWLAPGMRRRARLSRALRDSVPNGERIEMSAAGRDPPAFARPSSTVPSRSPTRSKPAPS